MLIGRFFPLPVDVAGDADAPQVKRVLMLYSLGRDFAPDDAVSSAFRTELAQQSATPRSNRKNLPTTKQEVQMITRRAFVAAALAAPVVPLASAMAQAVKEPAKQADFLFVQTAKGMTFDKSANKLTLDGISSTTLFFSDRPERIAGNMKTTAFVPFWSTGKDSFLKDPPNADVSILEGDKLHQIVVVLQAPELKSDALTYTVKVLQGDMPAKGADVSVFIDIIGMPMTPLSYAGASRRMYRRAYWR
jgi:hypothetical protein